jgi:hypothetical protein
VRARGVNRTRSPTRPNSALGTHELHRGADILGTVRITESDTFLDMLAEGGAHYHFLGRAAQKVVLVRRPAIGAVAA